MPSRSSQPGNTNRTPQNSQSGTNRVPRGTGQYQSSRVERPTPRPQSHNKGPWFGTNFSPETQPGNLPKAQAPSAQRPTPKSTSPQSTPNNAWQRPRNATPNSRPASNSPHSNLSQEKPNQAKPNPQAQARTQHTTQTPKPSAYAPQSAQPNPQSNPTPDPEQKKPETPTKEKTKFKPFQQSALLQKLSRYTKLLIIVVLLLVVALVAYFLTKDAEEPKNELQPSEQEKTTTKVAPFTTADAGTCLTWDDTDNGIENFQSIDCASEHRFEVASREDLSAYPASEFGPDAPMPDITRQAQLRAELCLKPTVQYLDGNYDPNGRYSVASILPPTEQWNQGDRTLLCGVQVTDENGKVTSTIGHAKEQDQARVYASGDCVALTNNGSTRRVDCSEPHQMEITSVVNLANEFTGTIPDTNAQDHYLQDRCTTDAKNYLGGDDPLYYSTLTPFWTTLSQKSWEAGSHSVNCALISTDGQNMAELQGSAHGDFTINGNPPEQRAPRDPVVNPDALEGQ